MSFYQSSATSTPLTNYSNIKLNDTLKTVLHTNHPTETIMKNSSFLFKAATQFQSFILSHLQYLNNVSVIPTLDDIRNMSKGTIFETDEGRFKMFWPTCNSSETQYNN